MTDENEDKDDYFGLIILNYLIIQMFQLTGHPLRNLTIYPQISQKKTIHYSIFNNIKLKSKDK